MSASEEIELALLGRLYRRITALADKSHADMEDAIDQLKKTLRNGEYRGLTTAGAVLIDEFAQPIIGSEGSVFDNEIFNGEKLL